MAIYLRLRYSYTSGVSAPDDFAPSPVKVVPTPIPLSLDGVQYIIKNALWMTILSGGDSACIQPKMDRFTVEKAIRVFKKPKDG